MGTNSTDSERFDLNSYPLSGRVMFFTVLVLSGIFAVLLCFYLYSRCLELHAHFLDHRRRSLAESRRRPTNQPPSAAVGGGNRTSPSRRGLDKSVLKSLPTFTYNTAAGDESPRGLTELDDCAVCLAEFEEGEKGRFLPDCGHSFHVDCIDMWFRSHSNCPLCRAPVKATPKEEEPCEIVVVVAVSASEVPQGGAAAGSDMTSSDPDVASTGRFGAGDVSGRVLSLVELRRKSLDSAGIHVNRAGLLRTGETDLEAGGNGNWMADGDDSGSDSPGSRVSPLKPLDA